MILFKLYRHLASQEIKAIQTIYKFINHRIVVLVYTFEPMLVSITRKIMDYKMLAQISAHLLDSGALSDETRMVSKMHT